VPKLSKDKAKKVDDAESGYAPFEEGEYIGTLVDVEVRQGPQGEYWSWKFGKLFAADDPEQTEAPGYLWLNTSLSDAAAWKLQEVFTAFNVPSSTDTDELIGEQCRLIVVQREITKGSRMGQIGNDIGSVLPLEPAEVEA
jgi:hypothetical protein